MLTITCTRTTKSAARSSLCFLLPVMWVVRGVRNSYGCIRSLKRSIDAQVAPDDRGMGKLLLCPTQHEDGTSAHKKKENAEGEKGIMQIICNNKLRRAEYKKITAQVYAGNSCFRDSLSSVLTIVTNPKGAFGSRTQQQAVTVKDDKGAPLASALLIQAQELPSQVQLSFFEALPNVQEAVRALVDKASSIARQWGAKSLLVSMNGHVNYGLGFLADSFNEVPCFGSAYTPPYYLDYFRSLSFTEHQLISYRYPMSSFVKQQEDRILERTKKRFRFRKADFSRLREEIDIYTRLNNECFANHPFYFHRYDDEDYELFRPFRWFLKGENLLIAEHGGMPIGFLLWYPDFNELIGPGQELGLTGPAQI